MLGAKRSQATIGLDIGSKFVKAVDISHSGPSDQYTLLGYAIEELPDGAIRGDEFDDRTAVIKAIKSVVKQLDPKAKSVVVALNGHSTMKDKCSVELHTDENAERAIMEEAERRTPFDLDQVTIRFDTLDYTSDNKTIEAFIVAARNDALHNLMEIVSEAGYDPAIIDIDSNAIANAFEANYGRGDVKDGDVSLLLQIGASISNIIFMLSGRNYHSTRDIFIAGDDFRRYLEENPDIDTKQQAAILSGRKDVNLDAVTYERAVGLAVDNFAEEVASELQKQINFFESSSQFRHIDRIYVCGGGAIKIPGVAKALNDKLSIPVSIADAFKNIYYDPKILSGKDPLAVSPQFMQAVGLGLRRQE